jgi:predicted secreted hydrolase
LKGKPTQNAPNFLFPRDEGRHVDALHEWWYLNSHLETKTGRRYGLFVAFFSPNIMMLELVDKSGKHVVKRIVENVALKTSTSCLSLEFGGGWWRQVSGRPFNYAIYLLQDDLSLSLKLVSRKPPLFVNHSGRIKEGLLGYSRYYALTNMKVSGMLQLKKKRFEVAGIGWVDKQWGSWDFGGMAGWNWFSIQLSNNVEILVAQCYHPITDGPTMGLFNVINSDGETNVLDKFRVECLKTWKSPWTDAIYGVGWTISTPGKTELLITPILKDQEMYGGLWEGCCEVKGILRGQSIEGVGYAEQFYFGRNNLLLKLISLGTAPFHYIAQLILGRADFGVWKLQYELIDRLFRRKKLKP